MVTLLPMSNMDYRLKEPALLGSVGVLDISVPNCHEGFLTWH